MTCPLSPIVTEEKEKLNRSAQRAQRFFFSMRLGGDERLLSKG